MKINHSILILFFSLLFLIILLIINYRSNKNRDDKLDRIRSNLSCIHPLIKSLYFEPIYHCRLEDSYTQNKKRIHVCVCDQEGEYYSENKIKSVILHEIAHAESPEFDPDHTSLEYLQNYTSLMKKASTLGIIDMKSLDAGIVYENGSKRKEHLKKVVEDEDEEHLQQENLDQLIQAGKSINLSKKQKSIDEPDEEPDEDEDENEDVTISHDKEVEIVFPGEDDENDD